MAEDDFFEVYKAVRRELTLAATKPLKAANLGLKQAQVLICLGQNGEVSMGELAEDMQSDNASATRIVAALEESGLVKRIISQEDRRRTTLRLTKAGEKRLQGARAVARAVRRRIRQVWSVEEEAQATRLLEKLSVGLRESRD